MNRIKKIAIILMSLIVIISILPTISYAEELNDAQRKALVDVVVKIVTEGNKSRVLRYSQGHRTYGYDWRKVTQSTNQQTVGYVNLSEADLLKVKAILARDLDQDFDDVKMPVVKSYYCSLLGDDVKDTIPFDCSSLCSAAYNMTVGTPFGSPWCSGQFSNSGKFYSVSSDVSSAKPGDILWVKGHVAIYMGDCYNNGKTYLAEASGFLKMSNVKTTMAQRLLDFLSENPKYIADHPQYNKKKPVLQVPPEGIRDAGSQVVIREFNPSSQSQFKKVATYVGPISAGRSIDVTNLTTTNPGNGSGAGSSNGSNGNAETPSNTNGGVAHNPITLPGNNIVVWPKNMVLEDQTLATSVGYFYKGTPTYGQYVGRVDLYNWFIEGSKNVLDWFIGFITYALKASIIGWTAILEDVMSNILNFGITPEFANNPTGLSHEIILSKIYSEGALALNESEINDRGTLVPIATLADNNTSASTSTTITQNSDILASDTKKKITIEDILFNRVPVLDINFFNFEEAGGQKLDTGSLLYKVRETIASWYFIIRMVVIMGMLVALIYLAIKLAISTAGQKAEYKAKLIDWLVGFIIVFFIHYFMIAIISFNNQIVKLFDPIVAAGTTVQTPNVTTGENSNVVTTNDGQTSLYEAIRIQAHDIKATTGVTATIMYMVLVFFMIRFTILYAKRMFVLAVLTVFSPLMGLLYSVNKKKYKIGDWGKEYVYNVLIQFVHVVIYTAIIAVAFDITKTSTFKGGLIALITLGFLMTAEGMVKKIFGFNKASSGSSLSESAVSQVAAFHIGQAVYKKAMKQTSNAVSHVKNPRSWLQKSHDSAINKYMSIANWANRYNPTEGVKETEEQARNRRANKLLNSKAYKPDTRTMNNGMEYMVDRNGTPLAPYDYASDPDKEKYFTMSSINNRIEEAMDEEKSARFAYAMQGINDAVSTATGAMSVMASIPMLVISPKYGFGLGAYGVHALASGLGRKKIEGAKKDKNAQKWTGKRLVFAFATSGISEGYRNLQQNYEDKEYVMQTTYTKKLELLKQARVTEDKLARQIIALELSKKVGEHDGEEVQESEKVREAKAKMAQTAKEIDQKEFEYSVNVTLQEVEKKEVANVVENYIIKNNKTEFDKNDVEKISQELSEKIKKKYKDITLSKDFSEILRDEVKDRVVNIGNYVVTGDEVRNKLLRNEEKLNTNNKKSDSSNTENDDIKPKLHIKDQNENPILNVITKKELEQKADKVINEMKTEEFVEIIDSALKRKEAINRNIRDTRFVEMMETAKELQRINIEYKELTGEKIYKQYIAKDNNIEEKINLKNEVEYQSVSSLVKNMRKYFVDYLEGKA